MINELKQAGLTEGEAKVYLSLLEIGNATTGPIIEKSKIARSFVYMILDKLAEKGLISYIEKNNKKYYQAANPQKILEYIETKKQELEESKTKLQQVLPNLQAIRKETPFTEIKVYEGFKGLQTVFEQYHKKVFKGEEVLSLGILSVKEEKYHEYWKQDHKLRVKQGIKTRMLFNKGTDLKILKNRNTYPLCDARYMNSDIQTPAWICIYKN